MTLSGSRLCSISYAPACVDMNAPAYQSLSSAPPLPVAPVPVGAPSVSAVPLASWPSSHPPITSAWLPACPCSHTPRTLTCARVRPFVPIEPPRRYRSTAPKSQRETLARHILGTLHQAHASSGPQVPQRASLVLLLSWPRLASASTPASASALLRRCLGEP